MKNKLHKKRNFSKQQVIVLAFGTNQAAIALLLQWIFSEHDVKNVRVRAFDADGSGVYHNLPLPTDEEMLNTEFQANTFHVLSTPGKDTISGIMNGQYVGKVNFGTAKEYAQGNGGIKGTGGSPQCGRITTVFNRPLILSNLEKELRGILEERHHDSNDNDNDVMIFLLFGMYGGFSSGSHEEALFIVDECINRTVKNASLYQVIIIPGIDKPKDLLQSNSIAYAGLLELAAIPTGRFYTLRQYENDTKPRIYRVPDIRTILLSNFNNSQGKPIAVDHIRQTSAIARLLEYLSTSVCGKHLETQLLDFNSYERSTTNTGELRGVKSAGISIINFDRKRLHKYSVDNIVIRSCDALLRDVPDDEIQTQADTFFRENRLLEGKGFNMLSVSLLTSKNGINEFNLADRLQGVILKSLNGQVGVNAVDVAETASETAHDMVASFKDQISNNAVERYSELCKAFDDRYNNMCRGFNWGVFSGLKWLEINDLMIDRLREVVSESLRDIDEEISQHSAIVENFHNKVVPSVRRSGFFTRLFSRKKFRELAQKGLRAIANNSTAELRYHAAQKSLEVLNQVHEHVKMRMAKATEILNVIETFRMNKLKELEYLYNLEDTYVCPNGDSLINTNTIQYHYERMLSDGQITN